MTDSPLKTCSFTCGALKLLSDPVEYLMPVKGRAIERYTCKVEYNGEKRLFYFGRGVARELGRLVIGDTVRIEKQGLGTNTYYTVTKLKV